MSQNQPFDIPQELRQLAEQNVERARQLYPQFIESVAQTMAVWCTSCVQARSHLDSAECVRELSNSRKRTQMRPSSWREKSPRPKISRNCSASRHDTYNHR